MAFRLQHLVQQFLVFQSLEQSVGIAAVWARKAEDGLIAMIGELLEYKICAISRTSPPSLDCCCGVKRLIRNGRLQSLIRDPPWLIHTDASETNLVAKTYSASSLNSFETRR